MKVRELDDKAMAEWLSTRPEIIKRMVASHPPDRLYRIKGGNRCTLHGYNEDGTVTVNVTAQYNLVLFERQVFGIKIEDLVECDPPGPTEPVGDLSKQAGFSDKDVDEILIPALREDQRIHPPSEA